MEHSANARHEVILSAGAIGSPAVLMRSGIGNHDDLLAAGVSDLVGEPLPDVGQGLMDGVFLIAQFAIRSKEDDDWERCSPFDAEAFSSEFCMRRTYTLDQRFRRGAFSMPGLSRVYFCRVHMLVI